MSTNMTDRGQRVGLAAAAREMSPSQFSRVINPLEAVQPGDPRILRLAQLLGVPPWRAFSDEPRTCLRALDGRPSQDAPAGVRPGLGARTFEGRTGDRRRE